ncbi:MAG: betaine--homocysteine S-methyltransferase [Chloroflexota bacterium]|nr:betaine--homocysteine S-methyltransferase [Chloroflexota bacterium]
MSLLQQLLQTHKQLLLDGGMGTMLMAAGLTNGAAPEEWNVSHPEQVRAIHQGYIRAGARVILTNSFGGNRPRLQMHDLGERAAELNRAAAVNARAATDGAPHPVVVAGSMGPTGALLEPLGPMTFEEAKAAFAEQAAALSEGGVDLLWIETMSDLNEVRAAVEGARAVTSLPVAATMTFDVRGHTMMGVSPTQALQTMSQWDLIALGANCGNGPGEIETVIEAMHAANPQMVLIAKSNAGMPRWDGDEMVYDGTPEVMAAHAQRVGTLGARLIGACCGSAPQHIEAMAGALEQPAPSKTSM